MKMASSYPSLGKYFSSILLPSGAHIMTMPSSIFQQLLLVFLATKIQQAALYDDINISKITGV